jgi:hypothetical protein
MKRKRNEGKRMKKQSRKSNEATKATKARKEAPNAMKLSLVPKAKTQGSPFNGDWSSIPSSRQLLALVIRSIETGVPMGLPTTREAARTMLGYDAPATKEAVNG